MKAATIYKRSDHLYINPSSKTTAGVWIETPPLVDIDAGVSDSDIGKSVMEAIDASQLQIPHPSTWTGLLTPLLEKAAVKTWNTFIRKARCVNVEATDECLTVIPTRNLGATEGFEPILNDAVKLRMPSAFEEIGQAVTEALALCQ